VELKESLKEHRARLGLSQEELAERIFVSRQTISNWETDRTYPDVQSLLLLSELFETSIDELVKGDVATMEKTIKETWKTMQNWALAAWGLVAVGFICLIVGFLLPTGPSSLAANCTEGEVLGIVLFVAFWVMGLIVINKVEIMKKQNDLVTYREIVAFSKGEDIEADEQAFSRRHPALSNGLKLSVSAISGFVVMYVVMKIFVG